MQKTTGGSTSMNRGKSPHTHNDTPLCEKHAAATRTRTEHGPKAQFLKKVLPPGAGLGKKKV